MIVLVTGASGFVGSHVARRLLTTPDVRVRAMVRGRSRAVGLEGCELIEADITQAETLKSAVAGVDVIVHAAAITGNLKEPYRGAYEKINHSGTENLTGAAALAGVKKLVVMSGLGTRPAAPGTYMATRWGMEEAIRASGIPHVILQPSVLFGSGAEFVTALSRLARRSPVLPLLGGGGIRFQPLWIEDLVTCIVLAAGTDTLNGRSIPIGGSEFATFKEVMQAICKAMGVRRLMVPLPLSVARVQARLLTAVLARPPVTPAALELFAFENATDLDAVDRNFGFHPRGFREHVAAHGLE